MFLLSYRHNLFDEAGTYFDKETGVLQAPMTIRVADQTAPVPFTIHAVVTNSDFEFDTEFIDFGFCTIYETVIATVKLTNKSILAHKFGFVNLPDVSLCKKFGNNVLYLPDAGMLV